MRALLAVLVALVFVAGCGGGDDDSAGPGDNLTVDPGIIVQDTTAALTLNAGDDAAIGAGAYLAAATTVHLPA